MPLLRRQSFLWITTLCAVLAAPCAFSKASNHPNDAVGGSGDLQTVMDPANPYNGGVDPVTMPEDARLAVFPFSDDQIFKLLTAPLKTTSIEFAKDEKLVAEPALADPVEWDIDTDGANHVYVKPHKPGLVNTLELTTNKHTYDFTLVASPLGGLFYQRVKFHYTEPLLAKVAKAGAAASTAGATADSMENAGESPIGISPEKANFDYTVTGKAEFKPDVVFDNGKFIWMRIPESSQTWPVPLVDEHGEGVSPNFIRRGRFLVVERLADKVVLRAGDDEVTVERKSNHLFGLF
jgi:type IV secretory pathway VirB9-like protein